MRTSLNYPSEKIGLPPGTLVHVGEVHEADTQISLIDYSKEVVEELQIDSIEEILKYKNNSTTTWVIVEGLATVDVVETIGREFDVHPLVLEDILNTHQRPKFEEYDDYLYIVLDGLLPESTSENEQFLVIYEQVSILVFSNFVFTFKEKKDELFNPVLKRIKASKGRIRSLGTDYLTYAILDAIVDQNFILIDALDDVVTYIEDALLTSDPTKEILNKIQHLKRDIIHIRKSISPVRELMSGLLRSESTLINQSTHLYFRDVSDHAIRVLESIETYRDILSGLLDIYISSISNKMNEVMKVLTVFASIFIPLTFLAGIYGMNFQYMPELALKWAYPAIWVVFITIPVVLLIYFRRKKWL
ncbi:magnesium/cobalt transporter CorA [Thiomicrorhabdus arctica]|uniref:magnesium/cobalt transporter CorA n=1 Tax=Thiomicrorhabdus arctica TaxID=131540 RepID=UPI00035FBB43|nr:magnesium/cobalt transporter CorA [Thiomicrorhabdus arctica]